MCVCVCVCVCEREREGGTGHFAVQWKLTGHCKPTIMGKIKIIKEFLKIIKLYSVVKLYMDLISSLKESTTLAALDLCCLS